MSQDQTAVILRCPLQRVVGKQQIDVEYETSRQANGKDWIGLFPVNGGLDSYEKFVWVKQPAGKFSLAPSNFGEYEFRYVGSEKKLLATSPVVRVISDQQAKDEAKAAQAASEEAEREMKRQAEAAAKREAEKEAAEQRAAEAEKVLGSSKE